MTDTLDPVPWYTFPKSIFDGVINRRLVVILNFILKSTGIVWLLEVKAKGMVYSSFTKKD